MLLQQLHRRLLNVLYNRLLFQRENLLPRQTAAGQVLVEQLGVNYHDELLYARAVVAYELPLSERGEINHVRLQLFCQDEGRRLLRGRREVHTVVLRALPERTEQVQLRLVN